MTWTQTVIHPSAQVVAAFPLYNSFSEVMFRWHEGVTRTGAR